MLQELVGEHEIEDAVGEAAAGDVDGRHGPDPRGGLGVCGILGADEIGIAPAHEQGQGCHTLMRVDAGGVDIVCAFMAGQNLEHGALTCI